MGLFSALAGMATVTASASTRWAVQTDGTQRADSLHDRKTDAVARERELAGNKQTELVIKDERGRIVGKDSRGNDPRRNNLPGAAGDKAACCPFCASDDLEFVDVQISPNALAVRCKECGAVGHVRGVTIRRTPCMRGISAWAGSPS